MAEEFILVAEVDDIAIITLNRPEKRNALHGPLIQEFLSALTQFAHDHTKILLINGKGESFCAGGDIDWMKKIAAGEASQNVEDARALANLLYQLYSFPKPTITLAHGYALGGGLGLLAASDITIAARDAKFGLPEVKIGLTPSIISPYVISAIGERLAHYYFLTGTTFSAEEALRVGLIHQITNNDALFSVGMMLAKTCLQNNQHALQEAKALIRLVAKEKITASLSQMTAKHLATWRQTAEAQAGLLAFLESKKT